MTPNDPDDFRQRQHINIERDQRDYPPAIRSPRLPRTATRPSASTASTGSSPEPARRSGSPGPLRQRHLVRRAQDPRAAPPFRCPPSGQATAAPTQARPAARESLLVPRQTGVTSTSEPKVSTARSGAMWLLLMNATTSRLVVVPTPAYRVGGQRVLHRSGVRAAPSSSCRRPRDAARPSSACRRSAPQGSRR